VLEVLAPLSHFLSACSSQSAHRNSRIRGRPLRDPDLRAPCPNSTLSSPERAADPPGARPPAPPPIYCGWADGVEWNGGPAGVGSRQDEGAALRCDGSGDILAVLLCIRSPRYYPTALSFLQGDALMSHQPSLVSAFA
jgi:hypothetical protein